MDSTRWAAVRRVFEDALDVAPGARAAFLERACAGDAALRGEVERLLAAHASDDGPTPPPRVELLSALAARAPLPAGALMGTWRLLRPLGAGGMGEVWEAEQEHPRRHAAVKVVRSGPGSARTARRFRDEIDALARLEHPGIARILEAGGDDAGGRLWYAMELVPGARPLTVAARGLPWRQRVALLRAVCEAVEHGHRNGVIHRDLKPSNILLGGDGRPRVIDFGVARITGGTDAVRTQAGEVVGTLASMAPEQLEGRADVRSDVYALGVVLHELLAGRPPYDLTGLGLGEAARRIRDAAPPPPRAAAPELPVELDWITARALEKDPELRYPTAGALAEDLRRLLDDEPVQAGAPTTGYRLRKFVRRHRVGVGLAALIVLLLVAGIVGTTLGMLRARDAAHEAQLAQGAAEISAREARESAAREAAAREQEAAARADAESAADEAEAVTQFLVGMLDRADPAQDGSEVRVFDALDAAQARMADFLAAHPRAEGRLSGALGRVNNRLGRFEQAEPQLRRALELQRARGLSDPESVATELLMRQNLGATLNELRRFDEADVELRAVVDARRPAGATPDNALANALNALAYLRHRQGRMDESEALNREAIALVEEQHGPGHADAAHVQSNLAGILLEQRRYPDAEALLVPALETLRRELGPDHPLAITALNNLAGVRFQQRRYEEAAELMQEAYDIRSQRLPEDHRVLLETRANLATLRWATGQPDEGATLLESVLAARLRRDPPWHPELVTMLCNLASFVRPRGEQAVRDVVGRLLAARVGAEADNVRAVSPLENLARFLEEWGLLPEALALWEEALAARTRLQPADAPELLTDRIARARLLGGLGRTDEARAEFPALLAAIRALDPANPRRALLDVELARAWPVLDGATAEELLQEALAAFGPEAQGEVARLALWLMAEICEAGDRAAEGAQWRERLAALSSGEAPR